jgi:hypothetical protein
MSAFRDLGQGEPADFDEPEPCLAAQQAVVFLRVPHVPISDGKGSNNSGALHEFGTVSSMKSRTLMPSARRVALWSSTVISISGAISVGAGEGGNGYADSPALMIGVVLIGVRVNGDRLDGGVETVEGSAARLEIDGDGGVFDNVLAVAAG